MTLQIQYKELKNNFYPLTVFVFWFIYLVLQLTPSSFGIVRAEFGLSDGNIFGISQPVRSDEYSTWTPAIISETTYGTESLKKLSPYSESIEPIYPTPNLGIKSIFQPFFFGFHLFSNNFGLSFFWATLIFGSLITSFYLGLKLFKNITAAIAFSLLLFANAFQQTWLTVLGVNSLLFPTVAILLIYRSKLLLSLIFQTYVGISLILSSPYLAGIPALNILLIVILLLSAGNLNEVRFLARNFSFLIAGELIGILFHIEKWKIFADTVYPGNRPKSGGGLSIIHFLTQFFPNLQYRGWSDLLKLNQAESASFGTVLPVVTILLLLKAMPIKVPSGSFTIEARKTIGLSLTFLLFTFWQISDWFRFLGDFTLISRSGEQRLFSLTGPILIILCIRLLVNHNLKKYLTVKILIASALIIGIFGFIFQNSREFQSFRFTSNLRWNLFYFDDFLFLIFIILVLAIYKIIPLIFRNLSFLESVNLYLVLMISAVLVNVAIWLPYNPLLPAKKIYELTQTQAAKDFKKLRNHYGKPIIYPSFSKFQNGWIQIVAPDSLQRILPIPALTFWQSILTASDYKEYKDLLNRYLYITIDENRKTPELLFLDHLQLPSKWFDNLSISPKFLKDNDHIFYGDATATFNSCRLQDTTFFKFTGTAIVKNISGSYDRVIDGYLDTNNLNSYTINVFPSYSDNSKLVKVERFTSLKKFPHKYPEARVSFFQIVISQENANDCPKVYFKDLS